MSPCGGASGLWTVTTSAWLQVQEAQCPLNLLRTLPTGPRKWTEIQLVYVDSAQKWSGKSPDSNGRSWRALCGRNVRAERSRDMWLFCSVRLVWWLRFCSRQCETLVSHVCICLSHKQGSGFRVRASDVLHTSLMWWNLPTERSEFDWFCVNALQCWQSDFPRV